MKTQNELTGIIKGILLIFFLLFALSLFSQELGDNTIIINNVDSTILNQFKKQLVINGYEIGDFGNDYLNTKPKNIPARFVPDLKIVVIALKQDSTFIIKGNLIFSQYLYGITYPYVITTQCYVNKTKKRIHTIGFDELIRLASTISNNLTFKRIE